MSGVGSASSTPAALRLHWDVFLSFRGEDTRNSITKNLYSSLKEQDVRVFIDDAGMAQGDEIEPSLLEAIDDSAAAIVVLSPRYGDSHWCLEELARICELRRLLLPVFFHVNPSDVRRQKGPFSKDFDRHSERFNERQVLRWREAMKRVGGISGFVYDRKEPELIQRLVNRILTELRRTPIDLATYTVGLDSRVEKLMRLLDVKSSRIQVLGLHGMGGVGKTTLAKALYNKLIGHFEYRCFISNVREISEEDDGLILLQNKLLDGLSPTKRPPVNDIDVGIKAIEQMCHEKRVLVVLDDVVNVSQLNALAGNIDWFGGGSRIIITTREKEVLVGRLVNELYEVRELYYAEALQLFSYHALRREKPTDAYMNISKQIVSLTGSLPLALEVFGSFLFHRRRIEEWEDALKKLQNIRPNNLQDVLKLSFDELDGEEKCVFLDIACLFIKIEMKREEAIDILNGCGLRAETAITVLTAKSLIKISEDYTFWMHDQLRDMGRQIVQQENLELPGMRSRMWDRNEIMTVLRQEKGTENVQGFILDFSKKNYVDHQSIDSVVMDALLATNFTSVLSFLKQKCKICVQCLPHRAEDNTNREEGTILSTHSFKSMINLRLLQINHARLKGNFKSFPANLKWLRWKGCPLKSLPSDYSPGELAVLDLSESGIERVWGWGSNKVAENLKVLNLRGCYNLVAIPDISQYKKLEKLDLQRCSQLTKVHKSVGNARTTLLHLNLTECSNLVELPSDVSGLKLLQSLNLSSCSKFIKLPDIGSMNSLKELIVDRTAISELPESIYRLTKLEKLSLNGCQFVKRLPSSIGNLKSLKELSLDQTTLEELPHSIGSLSNLETLNLRWCASLTRIPDSVGNLQMLTYVTFHGSAIEELPDSICSLSYLKVLSAGKCRSLSKLPDSIGRLASLSELDLDGTSINDVPHQIGDLKMIEMLEMMNCMSLESLPETIGSMLTLTSINLFGANIIELPESIGMLENLTILTLNKCIKLQKLPDSVGKLKSLHHLLMEHTAVSELPESFGMLSELMVLKMRKSPFELVRRQERPFILPTSFSNLSLLWELDAHAWRISGKIPDDFEKLSLLENLDLGYNNFYSLPSSLRELTLLKKLILRHCEELKCLPPLPSSLEELDVRNCIALDKFSDVSNLDRLDSLNMTNCEKVVDIPGLEGLSSLKRLYMSGCIACSSAVKRRLSKISLRNIRTLSMPGSRIPDWFTQEAVSFSERRNREIRAVIVGVVISIEHHQRQNTSGYQHPVIPDIQVKILNLSKSIFETTLVLEGVPNTNDDHIHLCRFAHFHPLVAMLRDGYKIEITKRNPPIIEGVQLKQCGIHLVFENDDDYGGNEEPLDESQQSVSEKLAKFFNSFEDDQLC